MSDELPVNDEVRSEDAVADGEFEEISSEEVDRVVEALEELIDTVGSENIKLLLEEASNGIYYLVYDEEDEDDAIPAAA